MAKFDVLTLFVAVRLNSTLVKFETDLAFNIVLNYFIVKIGIIKFKDEIKKRLHFGETFLLFLLIRILRLWTSISSLLIFKTTQG